MAIFIRGKQKRVRRASSIDGLPVDEFIPRNADPLWLHQNEMWELIPFEMDGQPSRFDEYLDDLARWEDEDQVHFGGDEIGLCEDEDDFYLGDFYKDETGFGEEDVDPCSDAAAYDLPF